MYLFVFLFEMFSRK